MYFIFKKIRKWGKHSIKTSKTLKKKIKACTLKYNNLSLLKGFRRFFIGSLCGLSLEIGHLDGL